MSTELGSDTKPFSHVTWFATANVMKIHNCITCPLHEGCVSCLRPTKCCCLLFRHSSFKRGQRAALTSLRLKGISSTFLAKYCPHSTLSVKCNLSWNEGNGFYKSGSWKLQHHRLCAFHFTRMSSGAGSGPGFEFCWPRGETPSTAWRPRPPPLLLPPPAPSPPPPPPLWPTDRPFTPPMAALLRSSSKDMPTTSPHR